jgi:hypothetical protein
MKRLLIVSAATVLTVATIQAQTEEISLKSDVQNLHQQTKEIKKEERGEKKELRKLEGENVSYQSKNAFYADFGNVPGTTWTRGDYFDEAHFIKDGQAMTAYYDFDAQLVGTTTHKSFSDLPEIAQKYINKKYSDYTIKDVIFYDDNEYNDTDMVLYGDPFEDEDSYFVVLNKEDHQTILHINTNGNVSFFKEM